jgi:hypothetical protein
LRVNFGESTVNEKVGGSDLNSTIVYSLTEKVRSEMEAIGESISGVVLHHEGE